MIKTKYYSDLTKKFYDVQDEAEKEEEKERVKNAIELKKKEEKAARAKEIEAAYAQCIEASKKYYDLRNKFIKDYGAFHMTYKNDVPKVLESTDPFSIFDFLF